MTGDERNNALFVVSLLQDVFGINSPIYFPYGDNKAVEYGQFKNVVLLPEETDSSDDVTLSEFGLPVMAPVTFEAGEYNSYDRRTGAPVKRRMSEYTLPFSSVVEFRANNDVTTTQTQGGSGTVKELYGLDDWQITIRGIAFSSRIGAKVDAQEQIDRLVQWRNICDSIPVQSPVFRRKEIYNIVINQLSILPIAARWNAIPFQIEAISDEPIELYLL